MSCCFFNQPNKQQRKKLHKSVRTDLEGRGALSRLSITQADVKHSGIYTCSVSDTISQSLRLHIIDGKLIFSHNNEYFARNVIRVTSCQFSVHRNFSCFVESKPVPIINNGAISTKLYATKYHWRRDTLSWVVLLLFNFVLMRHWFDGSKVILTTAKVLIL